MVIAQKFIPQEVSTYSSSTISPFPLAIEIFWLTLLLRIALGTILQPRRVLTWRKHPQSTPILIMCYVSHRDALQSYFTVRVKKARLQAERAKKAKEDKDKEKEKENKSNWFWLLTGHTVYPSYPHFGCLPYVKFTTYSLSFVGCWDVSCHALHTLTHYDIRDIWPHLSILLYYELDKTDHIKSAWFFSSWRYLQSIEKERWTMEK